MDNLKEKELVADLQVNGLSSVLENISADMRFFAEVLNRWGKPGYEDIGPSINTLIDRSQENMDKLKFLFNEED